MRFLAQYRDKDAIHNVVEKIQSATTQPWTLMEVCGGQTHAIARYGLEQLLPPHIELIHGPGCPVCVTDQRIIDAALSLAANPEIIFCTYADMLRVPGTNSDLLTVKAKGGDVRSIYSPMEAVTLAAQLAAEKSHKQVVFFAIGFETTAPANAMAIYQARQQQLTNFSALVSHFLVPPAIDALCRNPQSRVQGFLAAGHVCAVMGSEQYLPLAEKYQVPIVITGFEPLDILAGILCAVRQLQRGEYRVENPYARAVADKGNSRARQMMAEVFDVGEQHWRGMGTISESGLQLRPDYRQFDALARFAIRCSPVATPSPCISGDIMQGLKKPRHCPHFGKSCTPESPLGAPMVSGEGACAAYYRYGDQIL